MARSPRILSDDSIAEILLAMTNLSMRHFALLLAAVILPVLAGCTTQDRTGKAPPPRNGITEYRELADESMKLIEGTIRALDRVSAQTKVCPPKVFAAFAEEVEKLQAESVTVRARSQAIQARGDAYFENWRENLARVHDPRVRDLAERHRPELQQRFTNVKTRSQQAGNTFRAFLAGLRRLQSTLESDAAAVAGDPTRELLRTVKENGRQVQQSLTAIREELEAMTALLTPAKPSTKH
jgi:hypothetical protein